MAEIPPFLEVPGVPGGRVAMSALSPEKQAELMSQFGTGNPTQEAIAAAQAAGFHIPTSAPEAPPRSPFLNPRMTENQQATLGDIGPDTGLSYGPDITAQQAASLNSIRRPLQVGEPQPPAQAPAISPADAQAFAAEQRQFSPAGNPSPPGGPTGGPMGMVTTMAKGSFPTSAGGGGMGVPGASLSQKDFDAAAAAQAAAHQAGANAAAEREGFLRQQAKELETTQAEMAKRAADRDAFFTAETKKLKELQDQAARPGEKVDANRLWANKSTGQKILAGVAVMLSGLGSGLMGKGGNPVLEMIQKQIDTDIDLQREEQANQKDSRRAAVSNQMNLMGLARQQYSDADSAYAAAKAMGRESAALQLDGLAAKAASEQHKAAMQGAAAQLRIEAGKYFDEVKARQFNQHLQGQQLAIQRGEILLKAKAAQGEGNKLYVPGYGMALDEKAAEKARELTSSHQEVQSIVNELVALREKYGSETLPSEAKDLMISKKAQLMGAVNRGERFGALDAGAEKLVDGLIGGDPTAWSSRSLNSLRGLSASAGKRIEAKLKPYMNPQAREGITHYEAKLEAHK